MNKITNLVFEGGGTKGAAYAGCIDLFDQQGLYSQVEQVAGTSAGAITACLLACGAGSAGLRESVYHTDFRKFVDDPGGLVGDAARVASHFGMHSGKPFVTILKQYLARFAGDPELTFGGLEELVANDPQRYKSLTVIASNVSRQRSQIFNAPSSPNLPIWQAVRASMSIPLVFEPMQIDEDYYVDGGLALNFPIDLYDHCDVDAASGTRSTHRNPATLGFYLEPQGLFEQGKRYNPPHVAIDSLKSFAVAMESFLTEAANSRYIHPDDKARTVFIDDMGVSATDFDAPERIIDGLVDSGQSAMQRWLDNHLDYSTLSKSA